MGCLFLASTAPRRVLGTEGRFGLAEKTCDRCDRLGSWGMNRLGIPLKGYYRGWVKSVIPSLSTSEKNGAESSGRLEAADAALTVCLVQLMVMGVMGML